jgi:hypothetical protein
MLIPILPGVPMPDPNPYRARMAKSDRRKTALMPLQEAMQEAIETARAALSHDDVNLRLRAVHAISQIGASFVRLYEAAEIESRIDALESAAAERLNRN